MEQTQVFKMAQAVSETPAYPQIKNNKSKKWIEFGAKNDFPAKVIEANSKSPTNASINKSIVTYICGKGAVVGSEGYIGAPNSSESWDEVIEPTAVDYTLFGGFYWQIILNKDKTTVSVFHQDFSEVRVGDVDKYGKPETFKISKNWAKYSAKTPPIELEAWKGLAEAKVGEAYIFHHWDYMAGLNVYCVPRWYPSIDYVEADAQLGIFYKNCINNGFSPSAIVTMPTKPDKPVRDEFERKLKDAFTGALGANALITLWGENGTVIPKIETFQSSNNADVYNNVEGIIFQKIVSSHQLSSPTLAGVSGSGNLSGNASEIIDAYVLFNYTVVEKLRAKILGKLNLFTSINGTAEIKIAELDVLPKIRETENADEPNANEVRLSKPSRFINKLKTFFKWN